MGGPRRRRTGHGSGCLKADDLEAIALRKAASVRIEIVFRNVGGELTFVRVMCILDRIHEFRLEVLAFLYELFDALRIGALHVGESFEIAGLTGGC